MTVTVERPEAAAPSSPPAVTPSTERTKRSSWWARHAEALVLFVLVSAAYIAVAAVLQYHFGSEAEDGISRLDNASAVVFSNDKHLSAVGFVWNPLPSLTEIPLLLLKGIWPDLLRRGLAALIMSSLFMAGSVVGVRGILADRGVGFVSRIAVPLAFAATPMIVIYGADGMSEAFFIFFLVWSTRSLVRYVGTGRQSDLVSAGVWMGLGYLSRYEAAAAALGMAAIVVLISLSRSRADGRSRRWGTAVDFVIGLGPFGLAFLGWALLSAIIVKSPFEQFTSDYGNSRQIVSTKAGLRATTGQGTSRAYSYAGHQMLALEPLLLVFVGLAVVAAVVFSTWRTLVPLAVFGSVLAFEFVAFLAGDTFGWLRFYIMEIPLAACLVAVLLPVKGARRRPIAPRVGMATLRGVALVAALAVIAPSYYTGFHVLGNSQLAREEYSEVHLPLHGDRTIRDQAIAHQRLAEFIDGLHAARGQILTEASDSTTVRTKTDRQDIFTDTTDQHFKRDLDDPVIFGIRYILVAEPGLQYDALNVAYPSLWADGQGFGPLVASFPDTKENFRLYRVTATVSPAPSD